MYKNLREASQLRFSDCQGCQESCCDGSRFILAPLILDDFQYVYKKFLIAFAVIDGRMRALMLLSNRYSPCIYYKEGKCTIYDERPPACVIYPYTPFYDEILIDTSCPAVGLQGSEMVIPAPTVHEQMHKDFFHERMVDFADKLADTDIFLEKLRFEFRPIFEIDGIKLLEYMGDQKNSYIQMHKASLEYMIEWRG